MHCVCLLRKLDIVDSVLKKLEKHAENLEQMVCKRTAELEGEKQKTDMLLYRMLPRYLLVTAIAVYSCWNHVAEYAQTRPLAAPVEVTGSYGNDVVNSQWEIHANS